MTSSARAASTWSGRPSTAATCWRRCPRSGPTSSPWTSRCRAWTGSPRWASSCGTHPVPVVMVSTLTGAGARATVRALAAGAVDAVQKPPLRLAPGSWGATRDELVGKVLAASCARVGRMATLAAPAAGAGARCARGAGRRAARRDRLLDGRPARPRRAAAPAPEPARRGHADRPAHAARFTGSLAERLDAASPLRVREAAAIDEIRPDTALIAPGGSHLDVAGPGRVRRRAPRRSATSAPARTSRSPGPRATTARAPSPSCSPAWETTGRRGSER